MQLNASNIAGLTFAGTDRTKQQIHWDDSMPALGLRLNAGGSKSWVVRYRVKHRKHLCALGDFNALTLDSAKTAAAKVIEKAANNVDTIFERKTLDVTVEQFSHIYLDKYARLHKKSHAEDERRFRLHILPKIGDLKLDQVTRRDLAWLHSSLGSKYPIQANRVREQLHKMFNLAKLWGYLDERRGNPASGITDFKEISRDRWLAPDELARLGPAIADEKDPHIRAHFLLMLYTCMRGGEVKRLQWSNIDFRRNEIALPITKSGRPLYLPMSPEVVALLQDLPRKDGNPFVICGRQPGKGRDNLAKAWRRICDRAGIDGATMHDLRRTGASLMVQNGMSLALIGQVLNQSNERVTAIYARFAKNNKREALDENAMRISSYLTGGTYA